MTLHPTDRPVADPFLAAVRRRHPDVDLVLLPPEPPPPEADPAALDEVRTDLETVRARAEQLGAAGEERIELGTVAGAVRASARSVTRTDDTSVVDGLAAAAAGHGWDLRRHRGAVDLLVGSLGQLRLRASHATSTGVLVVEVSGPDRPVGAERARELAGVK